jgi:hypothetical protein
MYRTIGATPGTPYGQLSTGRYGGYVTELFKEEGVVCNDASIEIRRYYPWFSKTIPYSSIKGVQRVKLSGLRGCGRLWGSLNPGYWANLDMKRPRKKLGLILDIGKHVKPYLTPDDVDALETILREKAGLGPAGATVLSPFV